MANNRMWLLNKETGDRVLIAKYYPSTGWYVLRNFSGTPEKIIASYEGDEEAYKDVMLPCDLGEQLDELLDKDQSDSMWGNTPWIIEYENE